MGQRSSRHVGERLVFEQLEGRSLLSSGGNSFLFTPVPDGTPLAEHIHVHLTIVVNGQPQTIPAGIGFTPRGFLPIHTHDESGVIHIESPRLHQFHLSDFFKVWGQTFNRRDILGHRADAAHPITMLVNGRPSRAFASLVLRDHEDVVINLGG